MKRLVIKVGTAVLTQDGQLAIERMENLVDLIAKLKNEKKLEVILVSSGAVGAGFTSLKLDKKVLANKQALAAIGQPLLLKHYKKRFKEHGVTCAQMLFIADDFDLLFGDNDQLAAHVAFHFKADMLAILSDIDGYYNKNPREFDDAVLQKEISEINPDELEMKHSANSEFATGGIVTKLKAADFLMKNDIPMYLTSGFDLTNAYDFLVDGNHKSGTIFKAKK
jgi:glutamate 5-kinase